MRILAIVITALLLGTCTQSPSLLEQVQLSGELRVVTRNSATTYYLGPEGQTGFEYDLVAQFADYLGVNLVMYAPDRFGAVLPAVRHGTAQFAAAGLSITPERKQTLRFAPPYQTVTQELVYRLGEPAPATPADLVGKRIAVVAGSSHEDSLRRLQAQYPDLQWTAATDLESADLLAQVAAGELDYTIADSTELAIHQRYYPELRVAFPLHDPEPIAWAFLRSDDDSLYQAAVAFIESIRTDGTLAQLVDRYYGHTEEFDYVGTRIFMDHIDTRLPTYRQWFEQAANEYGLEWQLLAAIGYQESHWNPSAVSPTGVRGLMMLTKVTARALGVDNRRNAEQSIFGGAEYIARLHDSIPERIPEPDRTWLALAAYNVGLGHLEDARILTQQRGGDPDRWMDVRQSLPLLAQRKWYKRTRHGYARGMEPVIYVENIRRYYDTLAWIASTETMVAGDDRQPAENKIPETAFNQTR